MDDATYNADRTEHILHVHDVSNTYVIPFLKKQTHDNDNGSSNNNAHFNGKIKKTDHASSLEPKIWKITIFRYYFCEIKNMNILNTIFLEATHQEEYIMGDLRYFMRRYLKLKLVSKLFCCIMKDILPDLKSIFVVSDERGRELNNICFEYNIAGIDNITSFDDWLLKTDILPRDRMYTEKDMDKKSNKIKLLLPECRRMLNKSCYNF